MRQEYDPNKPGFSQQLVPYLIIAAMVGALAYLVWNSHQEPAIPDHKKTASIDPAMVQKFWMRAR